MRLGLVGSLGHSISLRGMGPGTQAKKTPKCAFQALKNAFWDIRDQSKASAVICSRIFGFRNGIELQIC